MPAQGSHRSRRKRKEPMRNTRSTAFALVATLVIAACGDPEPADTPESITLIAHESFAEGAHDIDAFALFTEDTGIEVELIASDDAGTLINQAVLSKDNPLADVLFGVDDTFLSRGIDEGIFRAYTAANIDVVDPDLRHEDDLVTPIDYGDVCFNYDKGWFEANDVAVPDDLADLTSETYASHVTVEHPATSSPGLAFMMATIDVFGEEGWLDWWSQMRDGGVNVTPDWNTAYYSNFTRYGGDSSIVMSYASSPPAEVIFAEERPEVAPTGVIEAGCYRQVEYAGILEGTEHPKAAGELIDFMLSVEFQENIPLTWFVFPANRDAQLPDEFVEHTTIPDSPTRLAPDYIAENRDRWINEWIGVMEGR
jgi:thiamine transport system substrate-binding protein